MKHSSECASETDGSYGSELLLKARASSLQVNVLTYRWNIENNKQRKVCNIATCRKECISPN